MIVLVCGGRMFGVDDEFKSITKARCEIESFVETMTELHDRKGFTEVVSGGAKGADSLAHRWATYMGIKSTQVFADWDRHGKAAGPIRNERMLREHRPQLVVAFPGGRGTEHMMSIARKAGVEIYQPKVVYASVL